MIRWIAILAAVALAIGAAYGQSASPQPTLPIGHSQMMDRMNTPMMYGAGGVADPGMMQMMMQMMQMMGSGMMRPDMQPAGMMSPDMDGSMCRGHMAMAGMMGVPGSLASHIEARLAFTRSELAITGTQDPVWQAYVVALRGQIQPMSKHMADMRVAMMDGTAFPARIDARIALLEGELSSLKAVREAAIALYSTLDDGQKQKADVLLQMPSCM